VNLAYYWTSDPPGHWLQCKHCQAYVQLKYDGKPTDATLTHRAPCPVRELEDR
jgi:hypothetical protein